MGHCVKCKVDETREAGMSNMRAFPACVWQKGMQRLKSGSPEKRWDSCSDEGPPCSGGVPITAMRLGCRRRIPGRVGRALV